MYPSPSKKVLFQITGSIAAYKACAVISQLVQKGYEVQTVLSPGARNFVGTATLEGLTSRPVAQELFADGQMMGHIQWARWADLLVLCPATANTLNRLASGLADDLIGSIFLAQNFTKPYLIFPAMNTLMLNHPATQDSLARLRSWGAKIFPTATGPLACGEVGEGKLLDPEAIVTAIEAAVVAEIPRPTVVPTPARRRVLVTAGGTRESVDGVRFITNTSTGRTGVFIAEALAQRGHEVVLLKHPMSAAHQNFANLTVADFDSFDDLDYRLRNLLSNSSFDAVIHSAAVADFALDRIETESGVIGDRGTKLPSGQAINLRLVPTPKLISSLREWSLNKSITIVGFKLTNTPDQGARHNAVARLFSQSTPNFVVSNDLTEIGDHHHLFRIFSPTEVLTLGQTKADLANSLIQIVEAEGVRHRSPGPLHSEPEVPL